MGKPAKSSAGTPNAVSRIAWKTCSAFRLNNPFMASILSIIRQRRHRRYQSHISAQQRSQRAVLGFGFVLSVAVGTLVLGASLTYVSLTRGLPPVDQVSLLLNPQSGELLQPTRFYDRTGQHLIATLAPS